MNKLTHPVIYLEDKDYNMNGPQSYMGNRFVILIQGSFCGHCHKFLPTYQKVANKLKNNILFTTLQLDGSEEQRKLGERINKWVSFTGVPYLAVYSNGKYNVYNGDRSENSVTQFIMKYL